MTDQNTIDWASHFDWYSNHICICKPQINLFWAHLTQLVYASGIEWNFLKWFNCPRRYIPMHTRLAMCPHQGKQFSKHQRLETKRSDPATPALTTPQNASNSWRSEFIKNQGRMAYSLTDWLGHNEKNKHVDSTGRMSGLQQLVQNSKPATQPPYHDDIRLFGCRANT